MEPASANPKSEPATWRTALRAADTEFDAGRIRSAFDAYRTLALPADARDEAVHVAGRLVESACALQEADQVGPLALEYLVLRPDDVDVAIQVAQWMVNHRVPEDAGIHEAKRFLISACEGVPDLLGRHELLVCIGELAEAEGKLAETLHWFERALAVGSAEPDFLRRIAKVLLRLGDSDGAAEVLRSARDLDKKSAGTEAPEDWRTRPPTGWPADVGDDGRSDDVILRGEADLYGYSKWLAQYLRLPLIPQSLRGFQHGWIWWDPQDCPLDKSCGLDPNFHEFWGALVQDDVIARAVWARPAYAEACGLPFLNFYEYSGFKGKFTAGRSGRLLFMPSHSTPWQSFGDSVLKGVIDFAGRKSDCTVMLGWNDRHLAHLVAPYVGHVIPGAGALETRSFYRLLRAFESHEFMLTNSMGSHVGYALACGMKVGLLARGYVNVFDSAKAAAPGLPVARARIYSLGYLSARFPGLVIEGGYPTYCRAPLLSTAPPDTIARLLGWEMTLPSELASRGLMASGR